MSTGPTILALNVGNTCTQLGRFESGRLEASRRFPGGDLAAIVERAHGDWAAIADTARAVVVVASSNEYDADRVTSALTDQLSVDVYRVGIDVPIPIAQCLDPETITGPDRLLNALAAYERLQQACIVVDAGTAVTVDFVDGEGTFHGGAIAPGAQLQLRAMHEYTDALPELNFSAPDGDPFGRSTSEAMLRGVYHGVRGLVRQLTEQYAESYGAYPLIIATGGDAEALFANDEMIDRIVPELTLLGIAASVQHALAGDPDADA
jgi:type III pantothenate kinase